MERFFLFVKQILRSWKKTNNTVEPELIKNENVTTIYYDGILVTKKSIPNSVYTKTEIQKDNDIFKNVEENNHLSGEELILEQKLRLRFMSGGLLEDEISRVQRLNPLWPRYEILKYIDESLNRCNK